MTRGTNHSKVANQEREREREISPMCGWGRKEMESNESVLQGNQSGGLEKETERIQR